MRVAAAVQLWKSRLEKLSRRTPTSSGPRQLVETRFFPTSLCGVLVFGCALPPAFSSSSSSSSSPHTQLTDTQLTHTQLTHTQLTCSHRQFAHTQLAHTQLVHTQLTHTH